MYRTWTVAMSAPLSVRAPVRRGAAGTSCALVPVVHKAGWFAHKLRRRYGRKTDLTRRRAPGASRAGEKIERRVSVLATLAHESVDHVAIDHGRVNLL